MDHGLASAACWTALVILAGCALSDLVHRRIPNLAVLGLIAAFAVYAPLIGLSWSQVGWNGAVAAIGFAIGTGCFAAGWLGGGDVKLGAAVLLWAGPELAPVVMMVTGAVGVVVALTGLVIQRLEPATDGALPAPVALWSASRGVPYGIGLSAAGILVVLLKF